MITKEEIINIWKFILVFPHLVVYRFINKKIRTCIDEDVEEMNLRCKQKKGLAYYLICTSPYRNLYYYRVGRLSKYLRFLLWPYSNFYIGNMEAFGGRAFVLNHPYSTIINAKKIGRNFTICQLTTIGNAKHGRNDLVPTIGDNVSIGANATIIGDIRIGNNVIIGAGSVVVKDVPDNCVVAGNPAKIVKLLQ